MTYDQPILESSFNAEQLLLFKTHRCVRCNSKLLLLSSTSEKICVDCRITYEWRLIDNKRTKLTKILG